MQHASRGGYPKIQKCEWNPFAECAFLGRRSAFGVPFRLANFARLLRRMCRHITLLNRGRRSSEPKGISIKDRACHLLSGARNQAALCLGFCAAEDFGPESDIDVLVEFQPGQTPGLLGIVGRELELSALFAGPKVDLRTPEDLSPYFRQDVLDEAEIQYAQG